MNDFLMGGRRRAAAALFTVLTVTAATGCGTAAPEAPVSHSILFIGNSLTYENDLPRLVREIFESQGVQVRVAMVALPNYSLEDHWNEGPARARLRERRWDRVVLQQGPSAREASRQHLREWSMRFAGEARSHGARPVLMTVWPAARSGELARVVDSYRAAAESCNCELAPAGAIWGEVLGRDPSAPLYGRDGFHPSPEGSWLAALTIASTIDPELDLAAVIGDAPFERSRHELYESILRRRPSM